MADTGFFARLKKMFQANAIVTIDKTGKRNVFDSDHKQQTNLSSLRDRYTKIQKSILILYTAYQNMLVKCLLDKS